MAQADYLLRSFWLTSNNFKLLVYRRSTKVIKLFVEVRVGLVLSVCCITLECSVLIENYSYNSTLMLL